MWISSKPLASMVSCLFKLKGVLPQWFKHISGYSNLKDFSIFSSICCLLGQMLMLPKANYKKLVINFLKIVDKWPFNLLERSCFIKPHLSIHRDMKSSSINNLFLCLPTICYCWLFIRFIITTIHGICYWFDIIKTAVIMDREIKPVLKRII